MILSIEQRLNLLVLLGNMECTTLAATRDVWRLMDRLQLDEEEKRTVGYTVQLVNGIENFAWNNGNAPPAREYNLSETDREHLKRAIAACPKWLPSLTRRWLEPLLDELEVSASAAAAGD